MYEIKKMERYLRVNLLGPGPRLVKKEFTGPRSHKGCETLIYIPSGTGGEIFSIQTCPGARPASCKMGTGSLS
jgi:hypothetical protein